jgi:deoxyribodipyrimidine photo-lyase
MPSTGLVWFRRDLRVHDHPPLTAAAREHDRVVGVFVLDRRLLDGRFPSPSRAWFLFECLHELRDALRERGGELVVREGAPEHELPALADELGADAVHFASDVSPFAMARDQRVEQALDGRARRHPGHFVADVGVPRTRDGRPFAVFSPFWRAWQKLPRRSWATASVS